MNDYCEKCLAIARKLNIPFCLERKTKMPHFDSEGHDTWICQVCGKVYSLRTMPTWRPDITGHKSAGNVCPTCLTKWEQEHCDHSLTKLPTAVQHCWKCGKIFDNKEANK